MKCSLHGYEGEILDWGYEPQEMIMVVKNHYRWTWKPPFRVKDYNPAEAVGYTKKDMVFGPFHSYQTITALGVTLDGFDKPVLFDQHQEYRVGAGAELTIKAGWEMHVS